MNSLFYIMVISVVTYLDILVQLEWFSERELLLYVEKVVDSVIIDFEVRAADYEYAFLRVFHPLEELLQGKDEDSICVEVLGSERGVLLLGGCGRGGLQQGIEVLQGGVQIGFQGVRIQNAVPLVVAPFRLTPLEHGGQGGHHRGGLDSRGHCRWLAGDRQLPRD
jgi:hypothetical protein